MYKISAMMIIMASAIFSSIVFQEERSSNSAELEMKDSLPDGAAILFDINQGNILAQWGYEKMLENRPVGSLLKLFTSYALLDSGASATDVFFCEPSSVDVPASKSCWYKPGHGNMTFKTALANSCNSYFRQWIANKDLNTLKIFYRKIGFNLPETPLEENEEKAAFLGFNTQIRPNALNIVKAAAALFNGGILFNIEAPSSWSRSQARPVGRIRVQESTLKFLKSALNESSLSGTGTAVGRVINKESVLVKTGTSPHWMTEPDGDGKADNLRTDGWCMVIYPASKPEILLLIFAPDSTGSGKASTAAARILQNYLDNENK